MNLRLRSPFSGDVFYPLLFLFAVAALVCFALSWSRSWQDFDLPLKFFPRAISNGPALSLEDVRRIFNPGPGGCKIGPPTRLRFVQDLAMVTETKFRIWLFNYIPPHPSVSLSWLFSMVLSPLLMYRLVRAVAGSRPAAWAGAILLSLSTGNLSPINKFSNPAKPLATFFGVAAFCLAARLEREVRDRPGLGSSGRRRFVLLLAILLVSFYTDETSWPFFLFVPVLFPGIFGPHPSRRFCRFSYGLLLPAATLGALLLFASLQNRFTPGGARMDLIGDYLRDPDAGPVIPAFFGVRYVLVTARNLLWTQLVPWGWRRGGLVYLGVLLPFCAYFFLRLSPSLRRFFLRSLAVLAVFIVYQSFGIARAYWEEGFVLKYPAYYGALLSLFLSLPLALLFSAPAGRSGELARRGLLVFMSAVLVYNHPRINDDIRFLMPLWENAGELDCATAREIRRARTDHRALQAMKSRYRRWSPWAYIREIEVVGDQELKRRTNTGIGSGDGRKD